MRHLLIALTLILSLSGCQEKEHLDTEAQAKHDAKIAAQARAEVLAELAAKEVQKQEALAPTTHKTLTLTEEKLQTNDEKNDTLNQMGIHMENDNITIDTNKTKEFFNDLGKKMDVQMKKISDDLEKGMIDAKEAGVEINEEHIHIDINKTQDMLEDWGKKLQIFVQEFDDTAKIIENNDTNKGK